MGLLYLYLYLYIIGSKYLNLSILLQFSRFVLITNLKLTFMTAHHLFRSSVVHRFYARLLKSGSFSCGTGSYLFSYFQQISCRMSQFSDSFCSFVES